MAERDKMKYNIVVRRYRDEMLKADIVEFSVKNKESKMCIWLNSPYAPNQSNSIIRMNIEETLKGKDIEKEFIKLAIEMFKDTSLVEQVSRKETVILYHKLGFRHEAEASLEKTLQRLEAKGSILMVYSPKGNR